MSDFFWILLLIVVIPALIGRLIVFALPTLMRTIRGENQHDAP